MPPNLRIVGTPEITKGRIRIFWNVQEVAQDAANLCSSGEIWLVTDATFQTNVRGLVLGAVAERRNLRASTAP
eukprot:3138607-Pyramimonas_sp.AAC.1